MQSLLSILGKAIEMDISYHSVDINLMRALITAKMILYRLWLLL